MSEEIREIYKEIPDSSAFAEEADEGLEENLYGDSEKSLTEEPIFSDAAYEERDDEFEARMKKRRARVRGRKRRRKILSIIIIIIAFAALATMCGRDIVRLKAENIALNRQHKELEEQRDKLLQQVENSGNREFVQDQARKQLRLLNPGEILFTFEEEDGNG